MLDPKIAAALMQTTPELHQFRDYLRDEARKLDSLDGLDKLDFKERAYEVTARKLALDKVMDILAPLLNVEALSTGKPEDSFVV